MAPRLLLALAAIGLVSTGCFAPPRLKTDRRSDGGLTVAVGDHDGSVTITAGRGVGTVRLLPGREEDDGTRLLAWEGAGADYTLVLLFDGPRPAFRAVDVLGSVADPFDRPRFALRGSPAAFEIVERLGPGEPWRPYPTAATGGETRLNLHGDGSFSFGR